MVQSRRLYQRARKIFLGGTQTISKQAERYDAEFFPTYIDHAEGCRLWDIDGNEYVDYVMALGPIILGYCHPVVDQAVREQLGRGVLFSSNSPLEIALGDRLLELIPNAERMRFFKTGAEATSAAVRLCRNFTGREKILSCGYHGWHDVFIAKKSAPGVPRALQELILDLAYGDTLTAREMLRTYGKDIACVIIEPVVLQLDMAFLAEVSRLAREAGALVVFDEIITGFRCAPGGVQELVGLKADLAVYGKAIANGFPLAVVVGRGDIFDAAEELWISSTFGGEALSLAAAVATLGELARPGVLDRMRRLGDRLVAGWRELLVEYAEVQAQAMGGGTMPALVFDPGAGAQEDRFVRFMLQRGFVTRRKHYWFVSAAHAPCDIEATLDACRGAFQSIQHLAC
jgi:glutamate-1-semialdehyde aminotransferase